MPKIAFVGAGSLGFTRKLVTDILLFPELADSEIALMDIDLERLRDAEILVGRVAEACHAKPQITACTDRREALEGADYCIILIQVGGIEPGTVLDFEIPKKYGLKQTIADTVGIGGIMRGLRTIPVLLSVARDMEEVCPDVQVLLYSNPMAINTGAMLRGSKIKTVGLCHSIQSTSARLAKYLGIPREELEFTAAGVNHLSFFVKLAHKGADMYPKLKQLAAEGAEFVQEDKVRFEFMKRVGYFGGESSRHLAEYVPHFIRRDREELIEKLWIPIDDYLHVVRKMRDWWEKQRDEWLFGDKPLAQLPRSPWSPAPSGEATELTRSSEYASGIIHSMETGAPRVIYGNVLNEGLITNLPPRCCVEVPCLVDGSGIHPTVIGDLPPQCGAYVRTHVSVHELTIEAALQRRRDHIYHAAMLDPHTAAELTLDEICAMVDELLDAHREYLPEYE